MPPGKRTPPLFDLLSRGGSAGVGLPNVGSGPSDQPAQSHARMTGTMGKPVVRVELKPQPIPQPVAADRVASSMPSYAPPKLEQAAPPAARPTPAQHVANLTPARDEEPAWQAVTARERKGIPIAALYIAIAVCVGLALAAWFGGYKLGQSKTKDEFNGLLKQDPPRVIEPHDEVGLNRSTTPAKQAAPTKTEAPKEAGASPRVLAPTPNATTANPAGSAAMVYLPQDLRGSQAGVEGWAMTPAGYVKDDPREKGVNYLPLGIFWADEAAQAVVLFGTKGMQTVALPMDKKGTPGNNRGPRYRVFAMPGLRSEGFSQGRPEVEAAVARVIEVWNAEKGRTPMQMGNWEVLK